MCRCAGLCDGMKESVEGSKNMKAITQEQFVSLDLYPYERNPRVKRWIEQRTKVAPRRTRWSALDILALEDVYIWHRLISALSKELIEEPMLHEFACGCAENFLGSIENPDPLGVRIITLKRRWMAGESTDKELEDARIEAMKKTSALAVTSILNYRSCFFQEASTESDQAMSLFLPRAASYLDAQRAARGAAFIAGYYMCREHEFERQAEDLKRMLEATAQ